MIRLEAVAASTDLRTMLRACVESVRHFIAPALALHTRLWAQHAVSTFGREPTAGGRMGWTWGSAGVAADRNGRWFVAALGAWAKTIAPLREPAKFGELIQSPWRTATYRSGDCDDVAVAVAAFAAVTGLPAGLAISPRGEGGAHIVAVIGDNWYSLRRGSFAAPDQPLGVDPHVGLWSIDQSHTEPFKPESGTVLMEV